VGTENTYESGGRTKFLCTVFFNEKKLAALSKRESDALTAESLAYNKVLQKKGQFIVSQALQPVRVASTVRIKKGKVTVIDGPFAETKEQMGGFILIEAKDVGEAIDVASKIPIIRLGGIEVRPIQELASS